MIVLEGMALSADSKLKQKYSFLNQNTNKMRKEIKGVANAVFKSML
jgi:hypothetical protein